jgi:hypothetical protein
MELWHDNPQNYRLWTHNRDALCLHGAGGGGGVLSKHEHKKTYNTNLTLLPHHIFGWFTIVTNQHMRLHLFIPQQSVFIGLIANFAQQNLR